MSDISDSEEHSNEMEMVHGSQEYGEGMSSYQDSPGNYSIDRSHDGTEIHFDEIPAFANLPPLDPWRKIRRELLKILNQSRHEEDPDLQEMHIDYLATEAAQEYAKYVLEEDEDDKILNDLIHNCKTVGEIKSCIATTFLEEEAADPKHLVEPFIDAHGLLMELHRDLIMDTVFNHVGIGLAVHGMRLVLIYCFSEKALVVNQIEEEEPGAIIIRGTMLRDNVGIYAVRIVETETAKELSLIGPTYIKADIQNGHFIANVTCEEGIRYDSEGKATNIIEYYTRARPDTIQYGQPSSDKVNIKHITLAHITACEKFPDPRVLIEEAKDDEKKRIIEERQQQYLEEQRKKREFEAQQVELMRAEQRKVLQEMERERRMMQENPEGGMSVSSAQKSERMRSMMSNSSGMTPDIARKSSIGSFKEEAKISGRESEGSMKIDDDRSVRSQQEEFSQREVREDLITAIIDAMEQQEQIKKENTSLERKVILIRQKNEITHERSSDASINMHKYLNTLANVHQVQFKMHEVHEQYNNWAHLYEENIYEKQERSKEIQNYFREFKREVAKGAEYARTGKGISQSTIDKWEEQEEQRDKALQEARIKNITLKGTLSKLEQQSKEKEKLADGLHLIDYEQLKIENQTLNEKIEERNEEIHKLRKKIEETVQILTHIKEKLQFVQAEKESLSSERDDLSEKLGVQRKELNYLKKQKDKLHTENMKKKQETGIVNSEALTTDLALRRVKISDLKERLQNMENQYSYIQSIISRAKPYAS